MRVNATVCWATLLASSFDPGTMPPIFEETLVEVTGTYSPGHRATRTDPEEPPTYEAEVIYVLNDDGSRDRPLVTDEALLIDWGRANESLADASRY
jgi:hypothetical protein